MRHLRNVAVLALLVLCACDTQTPVPETTDIDSPPPELLMNPSQLNETAPSDFKVRVETTRGAFVVSVTRAWAPNGADRFYNLVKAGFFQDIAFFRVISGFMAQFGIHGDPRVSAAWRSARITDDPVAQSNTRGRVSFATSGPNSRTTQLFINFVNNSALDGMGFSPFAEVTEGMDIVDTIFAGYGEGAPRGAGPEQGRIQAEGNTYLKAAFPRLDYIVSAKILENVNL
jgi:peptidyl-prolyl cis-trans isomerase A (cyclophilin A)